ncbi:MAG: hypothetical protein LIO81_03410 [Clostridiales bacterium]|nr:hypothetical protein [Clostridiales bacterium]
MVLGILAIVLVPVVIVIMVTFVYKEAKTTRVDGGLYTYIGEVKREYEGASTLRLGEDGETTIKYGDVVSALDSRPLYQGDDNHILLPVKYIWANPEVSRVKMFRLETFSTVTREGASITLTDGELEKQNASGFLYDGRDTYIFLEQMTIQYGEESVDVPPLSFAVVDYDSVMNLYVRDSKEARIVDISGKEVNAVFSGGASIAMDTDRLRLSSGAKLLLIADPSLLNRMEE